MHYYINSKIICKSTNARLNMAMTLIDREQAAQVIATLAEMKNTNAIILRAPQLRLDTVMAR